MRKYSPDDEVTLYAIVFDDGHQKRLQAYTDDKGMAKAYMTFHNCKYYRLKKICRPMREIVEILNENANDEIDMGQLRIRNRKGGKKLMMTVSAPLTLTETTFIREEIGTFMAGQVNYSYIQSAYHYLKKKYRKALQAIFLEEVMNKIILDKRSPLLESFEMDELMCLVRSFPDHFGLVLR